jgi:hypothetical protein
MNILLIFPIKNLKPSTVFHASRICHRLIGIYKENCPFRAEFSTTAYVFVFSIVK